jgi:hypothetical protein
MNKGCLQIHTSSILMQIYILKYVQENFLLATNNNNNIRNNDTFIYLFMCLLNSPKTNYKVNTSKQTKNKHLQKHR